MDYWSFALVVVLAKEKLVLQYGLLFHLLLLLLGKLFVEQLRGRYARFLEQHLGF